MKRATVIWQEKSANGAITAVIMAADEAMTVGDLVELLTIEQEVYRQARIAEKHGVDDVDIVFGVIRKLESDARVMVNDALGTVNAKSLWQTFVSMTIEATKRDIEPQP